MDLNTTTLLTILLLGIADVVVSGSSTTQPLTAAAAAATEGGGAFAMLDLYVRRVLAAVVLLRILTRITSDSSLDLVGLLVAGVCYATSRLWGTAAAVVILCAPLAWFLACHLRVDVRIRWDAT